MTMELVKQIQHLPANIEDLSKFVLVGREKLTSVRAEIRAIDKLNLAKDVREQKKEEAQMLAEALLDAETKIGELLLSMSTRDDTGKFIEKIPESITRNQSSQFQRMAEHKDIVELVKAEARERDDLPTRTDVLEAIKNQSEPKIIDKPHIAYNSGNNEWYTPSEYIESARKVLGVIDLDPASSEVANDVVKADQFYSVDDDGLAQEWIGNIWLNPPYSADLVQEFVKKLGEEVFLGNTEAAIVLVNNATETQWFLILVDLASAICFPTGRVKFWGPDGMTGAPLQGQAILYVGDRIKAFCEEFEKFGWITIL